MPAVPLRATLVAVAVALAASGVLLTGCSGPTAATTTAPAASTSSTTNPTSTTTTTTASTTGAATSYKLAEVKKHGDASSCWTAIGGKVYDVTAWASAHPGGAQRILNLCGRDATADFTAQHGSEREASERLATFLLGTLG